MEERLQKYLSECGIASRRKSEELINEGRVRVNGRVAHLGDKIDSRKDTVTVNGKKALRTVKDTYIMLHKPRGYITTMNDEMDRKCVAELIKDVGVRLYPIGRLDRESEGMLLMTNDGEFANMLMHPKKHVPKTYRVTVRPDITDEQLQAFTDGMELDGEKTAPAEVKVISKQENRVVLQIVLYEGKNRQIRRMCEALGLDVARLKRIATGSVKLGMLQPGQWRHLSEEEVRKLKIAGGAVIPHK